MIHVRALGDWMVRARRVEEQIQAVEEDLCAVFDHAA